MRHISNGSAGEQIIQDGDYGEEDDECGGAGAQTGGFGGGHGAAEGSSFSFVNFFKGQGGLGKASKGGGQGSHMNGGGRIKKFDGMNPISYMGKNTF